MLRLASANRSVPALRYLKNRAFGTPPTWVTGGESGYPPSVGDNIAKSDIGLQKARYNITKHFSVNILL